jgi:two-component system, LytTR family, sensor kinase
MLHPLLKNRQTIIPFLGIWLFVITIHFLTLFFATAYPAAFCVADSLISGVVYIFISLGLWYSIRFGIQNIHKPLETILKNILLYVFTAVIWMLVSMGLLCLFSPDWCLYYSETILSYRIIASLMFYICSVVIYYAISFYQSLQEKQAREMELRSLVREAQLNELRSQLHPHFLFNSLNSINSLTISEPSLAGEMIIKLSDFLRYSLSRKGHSMATFEKEVSHIRLYLEIEKVRFGNRLDFVCEMNEEHGSWPVPLMLLQPLVENAVKHGVYNTGETVHIALRSEIENAMLKITIGNNFDPDAVPEKGTGTGLANVQERMRLVYGQDSLFETKKNTNSFTAILHIPQTENNIEYGHN